MAKGKSQVYNVVSSYTKIKSMVSRPVSHTTEQLKAKGIPTLLADSLVDIPQCANEQARTGARSVVYIVVEQILFNLLCRVCRERMVEILDQHFMKYFDNSDTTDNVDEKILSANAFMAPFAVLIQREASEAVTQERVATKREKQLELQKVHASHQSPHHRQDVRTRHQANIHWTKTIALK